jgi:AraC-like DNA-binding protein
VSSSPGPIDVSFDNSLPGKNAPFGGYLAREECCVGHTCFKSERQYDKAGIGIMISGSCDYRAQGGSITGVPGTIMFANVGEYFRVRHLESHDIRRLVVWYDRAFLEQIADAYGLGESRFQVATLPPGKIASSLFAQMRALARGRIDSEDAACALAFAALTISDEHRSDQAASTRDRERILSVVGYIGEAFAHACSIDELAAVSGLSRYHFMRRFKAVTGLSVNQYVINTRLRAAAALITETKAPISEIAFDVGFNDISHFNTCFRTMFKCTPRRMRGLACAF